MAEVTGIQRVDYAGFEEVYLQVVEDLMTSWDAGMQEEIASHNVGWSPGSTDFVEYLRCSCLRYYKAYCALRRAGAQSVCDVGGFLGVFPVTLGRLGFQAAMTEARAYYSNAFDRLFETIAAEGVEIIDVELFAEPIRDSGGQFDAVTLMAVLEHYPHSHRQAMENVRSLLRGAGSLYVEVPNIAYWPKRWGMLRGRTPLVSIDSKYRSAVPFIGHHHEFTVADLDELVRLSGFRALQWWKFNYSRPRIDTLRKLRWRLMPEGWGENIASVIYHLFPNTRECISALCVKVGE